jgi:membrane-associated protein
MSLLDTLQRIGANVGGWLYLIAGGLAFAEAAVLVGMVLPGEIALLVAGFGAHQGWIALWPMVAVAVGSAALGDSVGYEVGRVTGPRLRASRLGRWVGERR